MIHTCESSNLPSPRAPNSSTLWIIFLVPTFHPRHRQGETKPRIKTQVISPCMFDKSETG